MGGHQVGLVGAPFGARRAPLGAALEGVQQGRARGPGGIEAPHAGRPAGVPVEVHQDPPRAAASSSARVVFPTPPLAAATVMMRGWHGCAALV